jgi:methylmalonyl-CoA mutase N-terminal domain/subunit
MRRLWARLMRERFGAVKPASWAFRTGAGSGASQLTAQQPTNNIIRVTLNALAPILGGAQSLHTAAYDVALALPTEASVQLALRTQQVLAHESGLAEVIDPLAGSYYVEALTAEIETGARVLIAEIEGRGGMVKVIESGWAQQQIADASWEHQREIETGARVVVGVNRYVEEEPARVAIHQHAEEVAAERRTAMAAVRAARDAAAVARALERLRAAAAGKANLVPILVEAVKAYATMGEICDVLRDAFGEYRAVPAY